MKSRGFRHLFPVILMALGLMAVGLACASSAEQQPTGESVSSMDSMAAAPEVAVQSAPTAIVSANSDTGTNSTAIRSAQSAGSDGASVVQGQANRQLVIEASLGLEVTDIDARVREIESIAAGFGGWTESAEVSGDGGLRSARVSVRVPAVKVGDAMIQFRGLGRVVDEQVSATDVTEQLVDNDARLAAWRTQETRLIRLLESARTVEDIVEIEQRISEVRTDIEVVEATQRNLAGRVATALVTVQLALPNRLVSEAPDATLTLSVGDPSAVADSIRARVVSLGGYIGNKREYQQGTSGFVVETAVFVRSTDLKGLMDYAATLGVPSARNLNSVGDPQAGNAPDARLLLTIMSNSGVAAEVNLNAVEPADTGRLLRERAESLGGYVERFSETRRGDDHSVDLVLVVKSSDVRDVLEYATTIADADNWEFNATGQQPPDDAPNARLDVSITSPPDYSPLWIALGVVLALVAVIAGAIYFTGAWRMAVRSQPTLPPPDSDDDNST